MTSVLNIVVLAGRLLQPPQCERSPTGPVWRFVVALPSEVGAPSGQWIDVWWITAAGAAEPGLRAGDPILVQGRLQVRRFRDRAGRQRVVSAVLADRVVGTPTASAPGGPDRRWP